MNIFSPSMNPVRYSPQSSRKPSPKPASSPVKFTGQKEDLQKNLHKVFKSESKSKAEIYKSAKILVSQGADINGWDQNDPNQETLLTRAVRKGDYTDVLQLIDPRGFQANLNTQDGLGWTPLARAITQGNIDIVQLLLKQGASLTTPTGSGFTPFMIATGKGNTEAMKTLLSAAKAQNIDILNAQAPVGWTPLTYAADQNQLGPIRLLHEQGADFNIRSKSDNSALNYARQAKHEAAKALIKELSQTPPPKTTASPKPAAIPTFPTRSITREIKKFNTRLGNLENRLGTIQQDGIQFRQELNTVNQQLGTLAYNIQNLKTAQSRTDAELKPLLQNIQENLNTLKKAQDNAQKDQQIARAEDQKDLDKRFERLHEQLSCYKRASAEEFQAVEQRIQSQLKDYRELLQSSITGLDQELKNQSGSTQQQLHELSDSLKSLKETHPQLRHDLKTLQQQATSLQDAQREQQISQKEVQQKVFQQLNTLHNEIKSSKALTEGQKEHTESLFVGFMREVRQMDQRFTQTQEILKSLQETTKIIPELKTHYELTLQKQLQEVVKQLQQKDSDESLEQEKAKLEQGLNHLRPHSATITAVSIEKESLNTSTPHRANEADIDQLLQRNPEQLKTANQQGYTPLINAAANAQIEIIQKLIRRVPGLDINQKDENGMSALHWTVSNTINNLRERREILEALLEKPALEVNATNQQGDTPLMIAIRNNATDLVKILLQDPRVDLSHQNKHGKTAVSLAAENTEITELLESANLQKMEAQKSQRLRSTTLANLSNADNGMTPLLTAIERNDHAAVTKLIALGADVNEFNRVQFKETPLMLAATYGDAEMIDRLLSSGADPFSTDAAGDYALHYAARVGNTDTLEKLLAVRDFRMDVNQPGSAGYTPLMRAAMGGHTDTVTALLRKGANMAQLNKSSNTALIEAAQSGQTGTVQQLLDNGADIRHLNNTQSTAFLEAAEHGHIEVLKTLLSQFDKPELQNVINQSDAKGNTVLIKAAKQKRPAVITYLTEFQELLDVNRANKEGHTALMELAVSAKNLNTAGITAEEKAEAQKAHQALDALLEVPGINIRQKRGGPLSANALERAMKKNRHNTEAKDKMEAYEERQRQIASNKGRAWLHLFK